MKIKYLLLSLVVLGFAVGCDKKETSEKKESKWITLSDSVCTNNGGEVKDNGCEANWENANKICSASGGILPSIDLLSFVVVDCGGEFENGNKAERESNKNNSNYQSCYKRQGFTSDDYWSHSIEISCREGVWLINFSDGFMFVGNYESTRGIVRCVREEE